MIGGCGGDLDKCLRRDELTHSIRHKSVIRHTSKIRDRTTLIISIASAITADAIPTCIWRFRSIVFPHPFRSRIGLALLNREVRAPDRIASSSSGPIGAARFGLGLTGSNCSIRRGISRISWGEFNSRPTPNRANCLPYPNQEISSQLNKKQGTP